MMPISIICEIVALPPLEKKGSEIPVFGSIPLTTPTLRKTWIASLNVNP
jgi:hypothetical protein